MSQMVTVPVTKGKGTVEIDVEALPAHVFTAVVQAGLKDYVNRGMSKITKSTYTNHDELKAAAMAQAEKNVEAMANGTIRIVGAPKQAKASGAVMVEARRIALNMVKQAIKDANGKISHYERKDLTAAANELLNSEDGKEILALAQKNLDERAAVKPKLNVMGLVQTSQKAIDKAEEKKAKNKTEVSATQAGRVVPRARPEVRH